MYSGPVRHQKPYGFAFGEIFAERPARIAVGAAGKLPIAQAFAGGQQRRGVAARRAQLLDRVKEQAFRVTDDRRGRFKRTHPVAQR